MTPLAQVIRPHIEPDRRVIAVSDVHGNLPFLKGVLEKVHFSPSDVLIIVGDLLEKGRYSLDTLRYVMKLQKSHTVYTLCGNCDYIDCMFLKGGTPGGSFSIQMNRRYGAPAKSFSYTHLSLPTILRMVMLVVSLAVSLHMGYNDL